MLLQRLSEYADRLEIVPSLYSRTPIRYIVELDTAGNLLARALTDTSDPANRQTKRGARRLAPEVQRASNIRPLLLADKADYVMGCIGEGGKPERVAACHQSFLDQVSDCSETTQEVAVRAVEAFLQRDPLSELDFPPDFDSSAKMTFRVDGVFPIDLPAVQAFWATRNTPDAGRSEVMQCIVCGEAKPVLQRLQSKIKGIPGGHTSGTSIISANAPAFESYGLEASLVAPTCAICGERFTNALNFLLRDEASHLNVGKAAFVFWTRSTSQFSLRSYLIDPQPEDVKALLSSAVTSRSAEGIEAGDFFAVSLTASGGRAVVRDWIDTTVPKAKVALAVWFRRQRIVDRAGGDPRPLGLFALAAATVRDAKTDLSPTTPRALIHSALTGAPVPHGLLFEAVRRNGAEQSVTTPRAALIKLVLASHLPEEEERSMVELDASKRDPGYLCGRLLAVLEEVQRAALPGINATIVDRFYGSASSAPASVFGRLVRGAQPHLGKLERNRRGAYFALQGRLEGVLGSLDGFPSTLTLEEQGLFALGYYHQRAFDRDQARATAERRRAEKAEDMKAPEAEPGPGGAPDAEGEES